MGTCEPRTVAARISGLKNAMIDFKALDPKSFGMEEKVGRVYALYQEKLRDQMQWILTTC
jgi:hypothetical protein